MAAPMSLSLPELAEKMAVSGPFKHELANRRVRGLVCGQWLFDTTDAEFVWEHPHYPVFYVPLEALRSGPGELTLTKRDEEKGFWLGALKISDKIFEVAGFDKGPLRGQVKIPVGSLDSWYAEDERQLGPHPKDPYKRIECLASSRNVCVKIDGVEIARSNNSVFLHETGLRTRYYISPTSVFDWRWLIPSDTSTFCPYKGQAAYYHIKMGDKEIKDAVWYYTYPTAESAPVQNRLCFYNEKVEVYVDGRREE